MLDLWDALILSAAVAAIVAIMLGEFRSRSRLHGVRRSAIRPGDTAR